MDKKALFEYQDQLFRHPMEIAGGMLPDAKALKKSISFKADQGFIHLLKELDITLFTTREYEHLLLSLTSDGSKIHQSFYPLPHPSGLAVKGNRLVVASTRNPNQLMEFYPVDNYMKRIEDQSDKLKESIMMPTRTKFFPGAYYFHDLAYIGDTLYGNSVGQNGVVKIDFNTSKAGDIAWSANPNDEKLLEGNYLQVNSIAAGRSLKESYFSASAEVSGKYRPGHQNFPVEGKGVIFSGDGKVVAHGLTRPHSARIYKDAIWVNNSGYGTFGFILSGKYYAYQEFQGWTRGLHFVKDIAFVGVSRLLEKFKNYAPGLKGEKTISAIMAVNTRNGKIIGTIEFPNGNQIFGIESMDNNLSNGFIFNNININTKRIKSHFYKYKI